MLMLLVVGCGGVGYRPVDLQLDVLGRVGEAVESIHMCVEGVGEQSQGAGNGRVSIAGLPADQDVTITLDFRDETDTVIGGVGPVVIPAATGWVEAAQDDRAEGCAVSAVDPDRGTEWVLGVRFVDEPW